MLLVHDSFPNGGIITIPEDVTTLGQLREYVANTYGLATNNMIACVPRGATFDTENAVLSGDKLYFVESKIKGATSKAGLLPVIIEKIKIDITNYLNDLLDESLNNPINQLNTTLDSPQSFIQMSEEDANILEQLRIERGNR